MNGTTILCQNCHQENVVFWTAGSTIRCDLCWPRQEDERDWLLKQSNSAIERLVIWPSQLEDGTWVTSRAVAFEQLRDFIDNCLDANRAGDRRPPLVASHDGIPHLIGLLESKIPDPLSDPSYLALLQKPDSAQREAEERAFLENHVAAEQVKLAEELRRRLAHEGKSRRVIDRKLPLNFTRWRVAEEARADFDQLPVEYVQWVLLEPDGTSTREPLLMHFRRLEVERNETYDETRLRLICTFNPDKIFLGKHAWEGYAVFCFERKGRAVLECPKFGNAIYLMPLEDWQALTQHSKTQLLTEYREIVRRLVHGGKFRQELEMWIESGGMPLFYRE
jgi:hypothetical protein